MQLTITIMCSYPPPSICRAQTHDGNECTDRKDAEDESLSVTDQYQRLLFRPKERIVNYENMLVWSA